LLSPAASLLLKLRVYGDGVVSGDGGMEAEGLVGTPITEVTSGGTWDDLPEVTATDILHLRRRRDKKYVLIFICSLHITTPHVPFFFMTGCILLGLKILE
jgi:hypothetical protein